MTTMTPTPEDHPMLIAFRKYKGSDDYKNTRNWAGNPDHVDGSLWASFSEGYIAAMDSGLSHAIHRLAPSAAIRKGDGE